MRCVAFVWLAFAHGAACRYVFVREGVDVAVLEVGIGGRLDATNIVQTTRVAGVTLLDYDHVGVLGSTLEEIAREVRAVRELV